MQTVAHQKVLNMVSRMKSLILHTAECLKEPRFLCARSGQRFAFGQHIENMICSKRLIYFGEHHEQPEVVQLQLTLLETLVNHVSRNGTSSSPGCVRVFLEHFSLEQQSILDRFITNKEMELSELQKEYNETGEEGFSMEKYSSILEYARTQSEKVKLVASFVPRRFAKDLVSEGEDFAHNKLSEIDEKLGNYVKLNYQQGSENHYNLFESLISGRSLNKHNFRDSEDTNLEPPSDRYRQIFPAQVFKDSVMAGVVAKHVQESKSIEDKFFIICGSGHLEYGFGVPERLDSVVSRKDTCSITARQLEETEGDLESKQLRDALIVEEFGPNNKFPSDIVFLYQDDMEDIDEEIKAEIAEAYNKVGDTANRKGNLVLAALVMNSLGYTTDQIKIAGSDAYNYQGVGNPHIHAELKEGETVLDIGSGLGVDSFIASSTVGESGKVFGLDISKSEVRHATKRAKLRGLDEKNIEFIHGDMERIPLDDNSVDCVISNGAFCLAPNKQKSFEEIKRVLKPGGRFSVACTTLLQNLDDSIKWPICMQVFMPLQDANPMLNNLGFSEVEIDTSDSKMTMEIEIPEEFRNIHSETTTTVTNITLDNEQGNGRQNSNTVGENNLSERKRIHIGSAEFDHLKNFNMDELCARVVLHGKKP